MPRTKATNLTVFTASPLIFSASQVTVLLLPVPFHPLCIHTKHRFSNIGFNINTNRGNKIKQDSVGISKCCRVASSMLKRSLSEVTLLVSILIPYDTDQLKTVQYDGAANTHKTRNHGCSYQHFRMEVRSPVW